MLERNVALVPTLLITRNLGAYGAEVMDLLAQEPTPREILVPGVLMHRWAERDGTYDELVVQRSKALAMLPSHRPS